MISTTMRETLIYWQEEREQCFYMAQLGIRWNDPKEVIISWQERARQAHINYWSNYESEVLRKRKS